MATKREFLETTDQHIATLQGWLDEIANNTKANAEKIKALQTQRSERVNAYASSLLPDLSDSTLRKLERQFPQFMETTNIKQLLSNEQANCDSQIERVLLTYDPNTSEHTRLTLQAELEKAKADYEIAQSPVTAIENISGFLDLYRRNYRTSCYKNTWLNLQYYTDWKTSDNVVALSGSKSWEKLVARYSSAVSNADAIKGRVNNIQAQMNKLEANKKAYDYLIARRANVSNSVIEKVQVALKAYIDSLSPTPVEFSDLKSLDDQITKLSSENNETWIGSRAKISGQLLELQKIRKAVAMSRSNTVPDQYMQAMQAKANYYNSYPRWSGGNTATQHVYIHDDSWMLDAMIFNSIMNDYGNSHSGNGGSYRRDDFSDRNYESAAAGDSYGRSS